MRTTGFANESSPPHSQSDKKMYRHLLALIGLALILSATDVNADEKLKIQRPVDGGVHYQRTIEVEGVTETSRVVVLTQNMLGEAPWRVGALVRPKGGVFRASIKLDDGEYDRAVRIVALGLSASHAARLGRPGTALRRPPTGLPRSQIVRITVAGSSRPDAGLVELPERIMLPLDGSTVGPTETVCG